VSTFKTIPDCHAAVRRPDHQRDCLAIETRKSVGIALLIFALIAAAPRGAWCQTPSPMQEWQYQGGLILHRLFQPSTEEWHFVLGAAMAVKPLYDGAKPYRLQPGPVIDIRYRDIAFASLGEGIGVNILRGDNYTAGISVGYDLGRRVRDYPSHLHGLGDIHAAPAFKLFGVYVLSKEFPLVLRADIRRIVGGADGLVGDLEAYMPLPGSSKKLVMFAGPSLTLASRGYMQKEFGVTASQAVASGYANYSAHGGANAAGFGFSGTWFVTDHWLINTDAAINHLLGSASASPITQSPVQGVLAVSVAYRW
jgi:outer membrane scaffolding protein for murein synthesis (MipA/OmpV family)